jgi:hypothetical protein
MLTTGKTTDPGIVQITCLRATLAHSPGGDHDEAGLAFARLAGGGGGGGGLGGLLPRVVALVVKPQSVLVLHHQRLTVLPARW